MSTTPLANAFLKMAGWQRRLFWPSSDEKELFRARILEASKFIVGSGYQLSIISINSCHWATDLAVVPEPNPLPPPTTGHATRLHSARTLPVCVLRLLEEAPHSLLMMRDISGLHVCQCPTWLKLYIPFINLAHVGPLEHHPPFCVSSRSLNRLCLVLDTVFLLEIEKTEIPKCPSEELKLVVSPIDHTNQTTSAMLSCRPILSSSP